MKLRSTAFVLAASMCVASIAGVAARPTIVVGDSINLETDVPSAFGDWTVIGDERAQVRDPGAEKLIKELYSQILTRTYLDKEGHRVMLSIAYGSDQRGGLQAHRPEVCYPAQGFKVSGIEDGPLHTAVGTIDVRRLTTSLGTREEPVTYWLTVGDRVIKNKWDKRVAEILLALTGRIPDGLLFRVSSIDRDAARAFALQEKFTADMMASVPPTTRRQLSGLTSAGGGSS